MYKVSKHVVDPLLVFDSPQTLKLLVEFSVKKEFSSFTCKKPGEDKERTAVDLAVYCNGRVFRLPLSLKFQRPDTMLRIEGEVKDLQSFFVVQPLSTRSVTTVDMLRQKIKGFEAADQQRAITMDLTEDNSVYPPSGVVVSINKLFGRDTKREQWRVKMENGGYKIFLKLRDGPCLVQSDHTHGDSYHSGLCYYPARGDITAWCSSSSHTKIKPDELFVPVCWGEMPRPLDKKRAASLDGKLVLRSSLVIAYGKLDDNLVPAGDACILNSVSEAEEASEEEEMSVEEPDGEIIDEEEERSGDDEHYCPDDDEEASEEMEEEWPCPGEEEEGD